MSEVVTLIINVATLPVIGLIGWALKSYLTSAIGDMKTEIIEAIDKKYYTRELTDLKFVKKQQDN